MIVATAGHVDHGKTSLVRHLTGVDTDRLSEEKARGLTIDLGFAYTTIDGERIGFIDVPGHIRFINNMLAGVSVIDAGMLVVAADDGVMPQTREHLAVLDLLGLSTGLVALTKIDRVPNERVAEVESQIRALLEGTSLAKATVLPVSSETGAGIDSIRTDLLSLARATRMRGRDGCFRLAVDRSFSLKGAGLVVTGSVFSGEVSVGDEVFLLPAKTPLRVRSLHRQNVPAESGGAGDRVSLNLTGDAQASDVSRGNWVADCSPDATARIDTSVRVLPGEHAVRHGMPVHVHTAANHVTGRVATLDRSAIGPGETGLIQLILNEPINVWRGDRLVIRDQGAEFTLGGGTVLDPFAPGRGRRLPARLSLLGALGTEDIRQRLEAILATADSGFEWQRFCESEVSAESELTSLLEEAGGTRLGSLAIGRSRAEALGKQAFETAKHWLQANATADGMTQAQLARESGIDASLLSALLDRLVAAKLLGHEGGRYQLPGQRRALEPAADKLWKKVEPILKANPMKPPVVHDLAKDVGLPASAIHKLLGECVRAGMVVRPADNRYYLPETIDELYALAAETAANNGGAFTVKDYRDATGVGRNLSIEILEYFDRTGRTVRIGDKRKLQRKQP